MGACGVHIGSFLLGKSRGPWDIESQVCFPEIEPTLFQKALSMSAHAISTNFLVNKIILPIITSFVLSAV